MNKNKFLNIPSFRQKLGVILSMFAFVLNGCGSGIKAGTAAAATDAVPTGTIESQGTLLSQQAGATVSGTVAVYNTGTTHILRLEGISIPVNAGNQVFLAASGQPVFTTVMKSATGNQDYDTGLVNTQTWSQVTIRTSSNTTISTNIVAIAVLTPP